MRLVQVIAAFLALSQAALAQGWELETSEERGWFFGFAKSGQGMVLSCTGQYPGAELLYGEGLDTRPYVITVSLSQELVGDLWDGRSNPLLRNLLIGVGDLGYGLPEAGLNELGSNAWDAAISAGDPLLEAMLRGGRVQVFADGQKLGDQPESGLKEAVSGILLFCDRHWQAQRLAVPDHAMGLISALRRAQPASATAPVPVASLPIPAAAPPAADAHIRQLCRGEFSADPDRILAADLDGDGRPDYVLDWSGVTCRAPGSHGYCGAANCRIDVFLSSRGYQNPSEFLGIGPALVALADGRTGVTIGGSMSLCASGACDRPWVWGGSQFVQQ